MLVLGTLIIATSLALIVRRVDVRVVLVGAGLALAALSGRPLAVADTFDPAFYGELVQFDRVIPWEQGIPVAHTAAA